jgi:hypothetical protein
MDGSLSCYTHARVQGFFSRGWGHGCGPTLSKEDSTLDLFLSKTHIKIKEMPSQILKILIRRGRGGRITATSTFIKLFLKFSKSKRGMGGMGFSTCYSNFIPLFLLPVPNLYIFQCGKRHSLNIFYVIHKFKEGVGSEVFFFLVTWHSLFCHSANSDGGPLDPRLYTCCDTGDFEGLPHLIASYDSHRDAENVFLSRSSRVHIQSTLTTRKGCWEPILTRAHTDQFFGPLQLKFTF